MLGGVAARLNLSFESLDDLETALDAALERGAESSEVTTATGSTPRGGSS